MNNKETGLKPNGEFVTIEGHRMHIFRTGDINRPKLLFMSGSGTSAPVYDFKILYEKLSSDYRIIVIEKFGYGYSDLYDGPQDIDSLVEQQRSALQIIGKEVTKNWIEHEKDFAKRTKAEYVQLDCGHYVHYYESERIKNEICKFVNGL